MELLLSPRNLSAYLTIEADGCGIDHDFLLAHPPCPIIIPEVGKWDGTNHDPGPISIFFGLTSIVPTWVTNILALWKHGLMRLLSHSTATESPARSFLRRHRLDARDTAMRSKPQLLPWQISGCQPTYGKLSGLRLEPQARQPNPRQHSSGLPPPTARR